MRAARRTGPHWIPIPAPPRLQKNCPSGGSSLHAQRYVACQRAHQDRVMSTPNSPSLHLPKMPSIASRAGSAVPSVSASTTPHTSAAATRSLAPAGLAGVNFRRRRLGPPRFARRYESRDGHEPAPRSVGLREWPPSTRAARSAWRRSTRPRAPFYITATRSLISSTSSDRRDPQQPRTPVRARQGASCTSCVAWSRPRGRMSETNAACRLAPRGVTVVLVSADVCGHREQRRRLTGLSTVASELHDGGRFSTSDPDNSASGSAEHGVVATGAERTSAGDAVLGELPTPASRNGAGRVRAAVRTRSRPPRRPTYPVSTSGRCPYPPPSIPDISTRTSSHSRSGAILASCGPRRRAAP